MESLRAPRQAGVGFHSVQSRFSGNLTDIFLVRIPWFCYLFFNARDYKMLTIVHLQTKKSKPLNSTGQKVRALRERLGLTQTELASRMCYSRNYISLVEGGREPKPRFIQALELLEKAPMHTSEQTSTIEEGSYSVKSRNRPADLDLITQAIPLLTWAQAGTPQAWDDATESAGFIGFNIRDPKAVAVQILGDTMEPQFPQGTIAIIYPSFAAKSGNLVLARLHDGTVIFNRLHVDGNRYTFISRNPLYPPVTVKKSEVDLIFPVGGTYQGHL